MVKPNPKGIHHFSLFERLSEREKKIIEIIGGSDLKLSAYDLQQDLDCSYATTFRACNELENAGILQSMVVEGSRKTERKIFSLTLLGFLMLMSIVFNPSGFWRISFFNINGESLSIFIAVIEKYRDLHWGIDFFITITEKSERLLPANFLFFIQACHATHGDEKRFENEIIEYLIINPFKFSTWNGFFTGMNLLNDRWGCFEKIVDFYLSIAKVYDETLGEDILLPRLYKEYEKCFTDIETQLIMLRRLFSGEKYDDWIRGLYSESILESSKED